MERRHALWDVAEEYYFSQVRPRSAFELVVRSESKGLQWMIDDADSGNLMLLLVSS